MQNKYLSGFLSIILPIYMMFSLTSCLPAAFTVATGSTLAVAKDRTVGETVDDVKLSASIKAAFMKHDLKELYIKIHIEVVQGRVLLTGSVANDEYAMKAVEIVWEQKGVKEVINELKIDDKSSNFNLVQYTKDSIITSQVKAKLMTHRDIKFINYTVVTVDDIVYLFGIARSNAELEKVADIAARIKGVKKVVSHVKMNGN